jgi:membrane fusion protein, multidrug efflux system
MSLRGTMPHNHRSERRVLVLGVMPLLAAAIWLLALREPKPAAAYSLRGLTAPARLDERSLMPQRQRFLGLVVAGEQSDLGSELSGQIVRVFAHEGERVRRGEPIVQLSSVSVLGAENLARAREAEDRAAEQSAELALATARDKRERVERASAAYSASDLQAAQRESERAGAELDKVRASGAVQRAVQRRDRARASVQILRAPFDAVVASRLVDPGDFVPAGAVLARIVDDSRFVRFAVPARELPTLQTGQRMQVVVRGATLAWSATLLNLQPEIDPASGFGFGRAELHASALRAPLLPGTRVDVMTEQLRTGAQDE